ncbi:MAG: amino acid--tRNA ligase-related protein, partial [bacterium]|nr:amino acid--tRNA ligase-related protein [bacterium]
MQETQKESELYQERLKKLKNLEAMGIEGFPANAHRTHAVKDLLGSFDELTKKEVEVTIAGRIRALRGHGKLVFGNVEDQTASVQFAVKSDEVGEKAFGAFQNFDIGDFVEMTCKCFLTKKGERTVLVKKFRLLAKSLRALPEKFHGLKDAELRLRKRYLDLIANSEVRQMFVKISRFWRSVREFMLERGFLEVETPVLENIPGGAEAEPFITHHNALGRDFYMRISLELPLKRLLVGGYEKVFEIGRIFRNEGIDAEHLQDYTQIEFYWAYADYRDLIKFLQEMYRKVILDVFGTLKIKSQGKEVDWGDEWKTYDYYELFKKHAGLDLGVVTDEDLKKVADKLGIKYEKFAQRGRLVDLIFKKTVRSKLIEPGFLLNPPVEIEPLAKRLPDDPGRVQRLQVMAYGTELGK